MRDEAGDPARPRERNPRHGRRLDGQGDQIFGLDGQFLLNLGLGGAGPGEFALPNGVAIGNDNQIYVADAYNRRVQVFKYIGQP